jgi:uncharacterized protein (DUF1697 family)
VVLLRGVNVGPSNRVSMSRLRELLTDAGYSNVATYLQSGNVVVSTARNADEVADDFARVIEGGFGLKVPAVVRTGEELATVVERNPLGGIAINPKRYQVTFLRNDPDPALSARLAARLAPTEKVTVIGREVYAWHPDGIARSRLWSFLAGPGLGVVATSRNWATVTALLEMASA